MLLKSPDLAGKELLDLISKTVKSWGDCFWEFLKDESCAFEFLKQIEILSQNQPRLNGFVHLIYQALYRDELIEASTFLKWHA